VKLTPPLDRAFRIIAFDWDGTAVESRLEDASPIRGPIERLLRCGVPIVIISGTNLRHIDGQLSCSIRGPHKRQLLLATNRGSEVYGFDPHGAPVLVAGRVATPEENRLLSDIAETLEATIVSMTGLDIRVIHDRLNRRKVDLIPLPEWRDPPKAAIGHLLSAVESRLTGAGLAGGLREVLQLAERICQEKGLRDARITSDVKHIEVGLTDKADSIRWVVRELARSRGVRNEDIFIGGDEFGPLAGFPGSDGKMILAEADGAVFVSVGAEPAGVPQDVVHLGGGPARFRELLAAQAALHPVKLPGSPSEDASWHLVEQGFVLSREHEVESLFAVGNGLVGTRGSIAEGSALSAPATFIAGVYETPNAIGAVPELVCIADWTYLSAEIDGCPIRADAGDNLMHRRILDIRQGGLFREWQHRDAAGRLTTIRALRLASQADRHVLFQSVVLTPENYSGRLLLRGAWFPLTLVRTSKGAAVGFAVETLMESPGRFDVLREPGPHPGEATQSLELKVEVGKSYRLDRIVTIETSRNASAPLQVATSHLDQVVCEQGPEGVVEAHRHAWLNLWRAADIGVEGDPAAQRALRFAAYHLLSAANPADEHTSIGARALTGRAYKGHIFWDTEIFMLPFFSLTYPDAARALLMYRYHTLPAARERAAKCGFRGALYAWESADTGDDVTPSFAVGPHGDVVPILVGMQEQHISADVAYGVWTYWQTTGDNQFLLDAGAEILVETARFWASRVEQGDDGRLHIRRVIGPDEYHESVDDNAYTNGMAQWNLERGADVAVWLKQRGRDIWQRFSPRIRLDLEEAHEWRRVASRMHTGFNPQTCLLEQFSGYFQREDIDLSVYGSRAAPIDVLLGRDRVAGSQVIKQADVVMLIYLLWDRFSPEVREANFRYYEPRTDHGSSLSPPVHSIVAARLGDLPLAERYFRQTADIDLADNMGNAAGGVHAASLGGLWQAAVFGFAGLTVRPEGPTFEPRLPPTWKRLQLSLRCRGRNIDVALPGSAPSRKLCEIGDARP
jgi:kojibiose phosphorylase